MLKDSNNPVFNKFTERNFKIIDAVKEVARQIGELRGISTEEIGARTSENFRRFFSLSESRPAI